MWCAKHCPGDPSSKRRDSRTGRQQRLCTRGLQQRIQGRRSTSIFGVTAPPPGMNFTAIAPNKKDAVVVPDGYRQAVVISWGDRRCCPRAPAFDGSKQSAASQRQQFGFNNVAGLLPIEGAEEPLSARRQPRIHD
jgi:hypothetical protein